MSVAPDKDHEVRIKAVWEKKNKIKMLRLPQHNPLASLDDKILEAFRVPLRGDKIVVDSWQDIQDAFDMFNQHQRKDPGFLQTLKLYLKEKTPSAANGNGLGLSVSIPRSNYDFSISTASFSLSDSDAPPLRTPPSTPLHTGELPSLDDSHPPPLRTPPASPPHGLEMEADFGTPTMRKARSHGDDLTKPKFGSLTSQPKLAASDTIARIRSNRGSLDGPIPSLRDESTPTPPLRTPPPSPPDSSTDSLYPDSDLSISFSMDSSRTFSPGRDDAYVRDPFSRDSYMSLSPRDSVGSPPIGNRIEQLIENRSVSIRLDQRTDVEDLEASLRPWGDLPARSASPTPPASAMRPPSPRLRAKLEHGHDLPSVIVDEHNQQPNAIVWDKGNLLGKGGFGCVYLGLNAVSGELFAVKQVELSLESSDPRSRKMVLSYAREIEIMKSLSHPNVVRYIGVQVEGATLSVFMEYVPGGSISSLISRFGPLKETIVRVYVNQILLGLRYLHDQSIVHRDIKGANLLVGTTGSIKLADFGCSKIYQNLTGAQFSSIIGTPYWMAPEVIRQQGHSMPADLWSLGCTVIEMITGAPPFSEYTEAQAAMFHIAQTTTGPTMPSNLSAEGADFLSRCFHRKPEDRATAAALLEHRFVNSEEEEEEDLKNLTRSMVEADFIIFPFAILAPSLIHSIFSYLAPGPESAVVELVSKRWQSIKQDAPKIIAFQRSKAKWRRGEAVVKPLAKSHRAPVLCSVVNASKTFLATGSEDKRIKLWSLQKQKSVQTIKGHTAGVTCLRHDEGHNQLWSSSHDKSLRCWTLKGKIRTVTTITPHSAGITSFQLFRHKLLTGSLDQTLREVDIDTGRVISTLKGHTKGIFCVQMDQQRNLAVSTSADTFVKLWDMRTGSCVRTMEGHRDAVFCGKVSEKNGFLITGSADTDARRWDIGSGKVMTVYKHHDAGINCLDFDQQRLATGSDNGTILLWDLEADIPFATQRNRDAVLSLAVNGDSLFTGSKDGRFRLIEFEDEMELSGSRKKKSSFLRVTS